MTAVWALVTPAAVAVKLAELDPLATVTDDGTVKLALLLLSVTAEPPLGAAPLKLIVQPAVFGVVKADGLQLKEFTVMMDAVVIVPPPALVVMPAPEDDEAITLLTPTLIEAEVDGVRLRLATTPLAIAVVFRPVARQTAVPAPWAHCKVLPAAVKTGPAATEKCDIDDAG